MVGMEITQASCQQFTCTAENGENESHGIGGAITLDFPHGDLDTLQHAAEELSHIDVLILSPWSAEAKTDQVRWNFHVFRGCETVSAIALVSSALAYRLFRLQVTRLSLLNASVRRQNPASSVPARWMPLKSRHPL
jgi:hypothetical protein